MIVFKTSLINNIALKDLIHKEFEMESNWPISVPVWAHGSTETYKRGYDVKTFELKTINSVDYVNTF